MRIYLSSVHSIINPLFYQENIFEWQFAIRGPRDSEFEGGIYHGRIQLPAEYPFKPPSFMLLTVRIFLQYNCLSEIIFQSFTIFCISTSMVVLIFFQIFFSQMVVLRHRPRFALAFPTITLNTGSHHGVVRS